ncbi:MAG: phosphotransferase family protein [Symbiobacteriia bacterium]
MAHTLLSDQTITWVLDACGPGAGLTAITPLAGATSSSLYRIGVSAGGHARNVVLRLFTNEAWLRLEPDLARHEGESLRQAASLDVPAPQLMAFDETGAACGVPAVLMTEVPGRVELRPQAMGDWLGQMAAALVPVHQLQAPDHRWNYRTYNDLTTLTVPAWSKGPSVWAEAIRFAQGPRPETRTSFIHRDYHPVNVLWEGDRLSGIVDWVNACRGPAGIDVGHCRLNLALLYGVEVADAFLTDYQALASREFTYHPYWDIVSALEFLPGPPEVYRGWVDFGMAHLTEDMIAERIDAYMRSLVGRLGT